MELRPHCSRFFCVADSLLAVRSRGAADVDDTPWLSVLDAEERRRRPHQLERGRVVQGEDGLPLLVGHFVDDCVPCEPGIVDDDVDLAATKFCALLHQLIYMLGIQHVTGHINGLSSGTIDVFGHRPRFFAVDVLHDDSRSFPPEQSGGFCADALA